jgi:hypothetical protein
MRKYSPDDLDRSWSPDEVRKVSDRELTTLAFLRDRKNFLFFFPQALILYFAARHLGVFGQVLGWVGIVLFSLFALQNAFNPIVGVVALVTSSFVADESEMNSLLWKAVAVLLSLVDTAIYSFAASVICAGIYRWDIY